MKVKCITADLSVNYAVGATSTWHFIECRGWVINTPASYPGDSGSKFGPVNNFLILGGGGGGIVVRFSAGAKDLTSLYIIQTYSEAYTASYPVSTVDPFLSDKAAGAWSWPFASTTAVIKNTVHRSTPLLFPYEFHGVVVRHRSDINYSSWSAWVI
jgi:hypothetical protein